MPQRTGSMPSSALFVALRANTEFLPIDWHFGRFCAEFEQPGELADLVFVVAAAVSRALREGHACIGIGDLKASDWLGDAREHLRLWELDAEQLSREVARSTAVTLQRASACEVPELPNISTPLVLDEAGRVYTTRLFFHEWRLALRLCKFFGEGDAADGVAAPWLQGRLDVYFPAAAQGLDLQRAAAERAVSRKFMVVSGGPGTGKTSTVVKILALHMEVAEQKERPLPRVLLLAPTGKAAARLSESVMAALGGLNLSKVLLSSLLPQAMTIHRALGVRPDSNTRYVRDELYPLAADLVVVDEGSMIDLALMRHLCEAIAPGARLLLLGDRHQLASVEAGSVFSDLCEVLGELAGAGSGAALVELTKSYRFDDNSGIAKLAWAVKVGDVDSVAKASQGSHDDLFFSPSIEHERALSNLLDLVAERWKGAFQAKDPAEALLEFSKFRVLCAHREGQFGVQRLNQLITQRLVERHWLSQAGRASRGQLIMILENDSSLALSNGDVGIVWPDADGGLSACFAREAGQLRRLSLSQLPRYELCFALTIHKSQGSEYDEVALILPKPGSRIVTRELLYTGLTRARRAAHVYGDLDTLTDATERRVIRNSGLGQLVRRFARSEQ